jgi:flagellar secretion chaperone FliS
MYYPTGRNALSQYQQVRAESAIEGASPNELVGMLFQGALEKLAIAKGHMLRQEIAPKGEQLSRVISIIEGLRSTLNLEAGGEIAQNLNRLYEYMERRLLEGNMRNDASALDEVGRLLGEIKGAWDQIIKPVPEGLVQQAETGTAGY